MYEIALTVRACLSAGTDVDVAWVVETRGFSSRDHGEALAITPGGGRVGSAASGALDDQLAQLASERRINRIVDLHVGELDATIAGLSCGGDARCLLVSAAQLPDELWDELRDRRPVCLVSKLDGDAVTATSVFTADTIGQADPDAASLFGRSVSATAVRDDLVITVFFPVPKLVVAGAGAIADALSDAAGLLGWTTQVVGDVTTATGVIGGLSGIDKVVVISHDNEVAGPSLEAALAGQAGYIGALGSRHTQHSRAQWLADRGITDLDRVHGPAGLDIGARTPAEIAVSILAEALATGAGRDAGSLRARDGAIH
ncbi:MAG TPA: XdhC family protein [Mycobacteriales bacterium]|nr:XdhC family protein [Mycobacteriales bacterium]